MLFLGLRSDLHSSKLSFYFPFLQVSVAKSFFGGWFLGFVDLGFVFVLFYFVLCHVQRFNNSHLPLLLGKPLSQLSHAQAQLSTGYHFPTITKQQRQHM